jgi:hypothetical protein
MGAPQMPDYRAYIIGIEGRFIGAEVLSNHVDDAAAIEATKQLIDGHDIELWDRDRLVVRLTPKDKNK